MSEQEPIDTSVREDKLKEFLQVVKDFQSGEYVMSEWEAQALDPNNPNKPRPKIEPKSLPKRAT